MTVLQALRGLRPRRCETARRAPRNPPLLPARRLPGGVGLEPGRRLVVQLFQEAVTRLMFLPPRGGLVEVLLRVVTPAEPRVRHRQVVPVVGVARVPEGDRLLQRGDARLVLPVAVEGPAELVVG